MAKESTLLFNAHKQLLISNITITFMRKIFLVEKSWYFISVGSGSVIHSNESLDPYPYPYQNKPDPQHFKLKVHINVYVFTGVYILQNTMLWLLGKKNEN